MANMSPAPESSYDADEFGQYQSLSTMAVMALILGLLSSIAFFSSLLIVVPLCAVGLSLWALLRIKHSEGGLLGTRLAYCGLALAIFFGSATFARTYYRAELLKRQASKTMDLWLSALAQEEAEQALKLMTTKAVSSLGDPGSGDVTVPIFEQELRTAQILRDPFAAALIARRQSGQESTLPSTAHLVFDMTKPRVVFYFQMPNQQDEDSVYAVSVVKAGGHMGPAAWLVEGWNSEDITLP